MKIIAVMSPKGGIGKTTTADSVAYILGTEYKKRVLIIDGDPQGDTSKTFGVYDPDGIGLSELIEHHADDGEVYSISELIQTTRYENIDIIPGNGYLMQTDMMLLMRNEDENRIMRLRDALIEVSGAYDYCICDCGRLFDMVVVNILMAASLIIAPVKIGGYENEALRILQEQTEDMKEYNLGMEIKVIMTMRQKNKTSLEMESWLHEEYGQKMFKTSIRRSIAAEKASMMMIPLPEFSKRGTAAQDYSSMVREIIEEA